MINTQTFSIIYPQGCDRYANFHGYTIHPLGPDEYISLSLCQSYTIHPRIVYSIGCSKHNKISDIIHSVSFYVEMYYQTLFYSSSML